MSEDVTSIELHLGNPSQYNKEVVENVVKRFVRENDSDPDGVTSYISGNDIRFSIEFCAFESSTLKELALTLVKYTARDFVFSTWLETTDETIFYTLRNKEIEEFESKESLEEYKAELLHSRARSNKAKEKFQFDFGRPKTNRTALVRLNIRNKAQRNNIVSLFNSAIGIKSKEEYSKFIDEFQAFVICENRDVKWCAFKRQGAKHWQYEGPESLINGLKFTFVDRTFVFLGFDTQYLPEHEKTDDSIENFIFVLSNLIGVSKTWIKLRLGENTAKEKYIYHPGMGDEPIVLRRDITCDSEWIK